MPRLTTLLLISLVPWGLMAQQASEQTASSESRVVWVGDQSFSYGPVIRLQNTVQLGDAPLNDIVVYQEDGSPIDFAKIFARSEYTLVTGACLTCGAFINSFAGIEAIERDFRDQDIQFLYVYRTLSHPERNDYVEPLTIEERLMHIAEAKRVLRVQIPFVADDMDNSVKVAWGNIPNPAFILDREGRVLYMSAWADPELVRPELVKLFGVVDNPTSVADLDINHDYKFNLEPGDKTIELIETPDTMYPLVRDPQPSDYPFYAKLRADVEPQVLEGEPGKLYLGFRMDAMYPVGWNNLAEPVEVKIDAPDGIAITPDLVYAPDPDPYKDKSPREFLLDMQVKEETDEPFSVTVNYYACDDADTWCIPISQTYLVHLERDPFAGAVEQRLWRAQRERTNPTFRIEAFQE